MYHKYSRHHSLMVCSHMLSPVTLFYSSAIIQELREEVRVVQGYLDSANEQIQVNSFEEILIVLK